MEIERRQRQRSYPPRLRGLLRWSTAAPATGLRVFSTRKQPGAAGPTHESRPRRSVQDFGGFLGFQSAEIMQLDKLGLALIQLRQRDQRLVERNQILGPIRDFTGLGERNEQRRAAALLPAAGNGLIRQCPPHHLGGHCIELRAATPFDRIPLEQPHVRFVNEGGWLERVTRPFPAHIDAGEQTQLRLHHRR